MARTNTIARTQTFTRINLVVIQFKICLRRTTDSSEIVLEKIHEGINNKWIEELRIYALDEKKLCRAQLLLKIDWEQHNYQLLLGKETVEINKKWKNNTAIELDEFIKEFNEFVTHNSLTIEWRIGYPDWINSNPVKKKEVRQKLGFKEADAIKWAGEQISGSMGVPELSELQIGLTWVQ